MFKKKPAEPTEPKTAAAITDSAPCEKSLRLHVGQEVIAPVRSSVVAECQKEAALPGFRKGRAPIELVNRQYAKAIQEETLQRVTRQALERAAKEHDVRPVGPFEVRRADYQETAGLTLEATVEVEPAFALGEYKGIALKQEAVTVTPADVEKALAGLQESMTQLVPTGEGQPKQRQAPAIDDELAKDLGCESLAKLREHLEAKLREQQRASQARALEGALCDALLARHGFAVPARLVARQTERLTRDFQVRLLLSGVAEAQLQEETTKFTQQLRVNAERHVKLGFILDRIAEQERVAVTQDELVGRLWQLAQRWKKDPAEVKHLLDRQGLWPSVVSTIRQEKTIALVLAAAAIENGSAAGQTVR